MEDELVTRRNIYIALEDVNFVWNEADIIRVGKMAALGKTAEQIAQEFHRPIQDVIVAMLDRQWQSSRAEKLIRANRTSFRSSSRMTKEQYLDYKRCDMTDAQIASHEKMGMGTLSNLKKEWGIWQGRGGNMKKKRQELLARSESQ